MVSVGKVFALTLFALSWLSWIVMLGGVAGMQSKCGGYLGFKIKIKLPGDTAEDGDVVDGCDTTNTTAFIWWSTWFEFFMLILLSVAECGRVKGLYLTKQLFLAMVSVCMMLAADRAHVVISEYKGGLRTAAQVCMAGQVITLVCNLIMLLHFGGEVAELRAVHGGDKGGDSMPISADLQMGGPSHNPYESEFHRLVAVGSTGMVVPPSPPESKSAQRSSKMAAAALGTGSWQA